MTGHSQEVDVASFEPAILKAPFALDARYRAVWPRYCGTGPDPPAESLAVIQALHKAGVPIRARQRHRPRGIRPSPRAGTVRRSRHDAARSDPVRDGRLGPRDESRPRLRGDRARQARRHDERGPHRVVLLLERLLAEAREGFKLGWVEGRRAQICKMLHEAPLTFFERRVRESVPFAAGVIACGLRTGVVLARKQGHPDRALIGGNAAFYSRANTP